MSTRPLEGKKIAILLETEYIPEEIQFYRDRFGELGATVHFMSQLWGQRELTFVSDVDRPGKTLEETRAKLQTMTVSIDFDAVNLADYAAVLMAANYTSVRLRYFEAPAGRPMTPQMVRDAPAVRFFFRAMRDRKIIKGALCHGLWILTPTPEHLAGRRVSCHPVVLADVHNAGGVFVPRIADRSAATALQPAPGVVVDGDLVTGDSVNVVGDYVEAIKEGILRVERERDSASAPAPAPAPAPFVPAGGAPRRILIVVSEWGYWGEELIGPLDIFDQAGYRTDIATPTGKRPRALPPSMDPFYIDPPLNRSVTSEEVARKVRELDDESPTRTAQSRRLDNPRSLAGWIPERPYFSHPQLVHALEVYYRDLGRVAREIEVYDAILIVGGSGAMVDLANNQRVHDLIRAFLGKNKLVVAECYGVACLAFARDINDRESIIRGKHVTGHLVEYDYMAGTGFLRTDIDVGPPFYPLEYILRDATQPGGAFVGNFGKDVSVVVDYPFITGRSTPDAYPTAQRTVEALEHGLRRFGW